MPDTMQALDDILVLDIATFIAAPFAASSLAEFGARVIKIEKPVEGDYLRQLGTPSEAGDSYWWLNDARNKECITLDLRQDQGQVIFKTLVAKADVLVENFRPGTLERWGLGFDTLLAINPKLVMLRVSAYGQTGPKSSLPGFARIAQAYGGLSYLTGLPETEPLTPGSSTLADYLTGLYGVFGIMLALRARDRFGYGQFIDMGCTMVFFVSLMKLPLFMIRLVRFASVLERKCPTQHPTAITHARTVIGLRLPVPMTKCLNA